MLREHQISAVAATLVAINVKWATFDNGEQDQGDDDHDPWNWATT